MVATELLAVPNGWLLTYVVPPGELALWLLAIVVTVRWFRRRSRARWPWIAALVATSAGAVWFTNWSLLHPRSYFAVHRAQFAYLAAHPPASDAYYGERLPVWLGDVSTDGRSAYVGRDAIFVPQWIGVPDDAVGYVHVPPGTPGSEFLDLYGWALELDDCDHLGGGWHWCPTRSGRLQDRHVLPR